MKNKFLYLILVAALLVACGGPTATPTPHPTVTASAPAGSQQRFTARITVGATDVIRTDVIYLGSVTINYVVDEQGNVRAPVDYTSPICYITPAGDCQESGAGDLLVNGVTIRIESGCWLATGTGTALTFPLPCSDSQSAITKPLLKPEIQATQYRVYLPSIISSGLECSHEFIDWVWLQPVTAGLNYAVLNCWRVLYPFNEELGGHFDEFGNPAPPLCPPLWSVWEPVFNTSECWRINHPTPTSAP